MISEKQHSHLIASPPPSCSVKAPKEMRVMYLLKFPNAVCDENKQLHGIIYLKITTIRRCP